MRPSAVLTLAGFTTIASSSPLSPSRTQLEARQGDGTSSAACAQVSQHMYGDGTSVVNTQMPAKMAFDCLNSVPFNGTSAKKLVASLKPYINWQSTLTTLKNPPAEYVEKVQPPIDIMGGLDKLVSDIDANRFLSEYEFGWALYTLIQSAHDGHFSYIPDSIGQIFGWGRPVPLVSVSSDGQEVPAVFVFSDVLGMHFKNISYTPSPVYQIDGVEVDEWLEKFSQHGSLQDRDALYNNVFYSLAQVSLGTQGSGTGMFTGGGRGRYVYPGATTTLRFANGTDYTMTNYARVQINFRDINSGEDLGNKWFSWGSDASVFNVQSVDTQNIETISTAALDESSAAAAPGYPAPAIAGPYNLINGFFIDVPGYEDVAVLQVPNFVGATQYETAFQRTTQRFLPAAKAAGKTKLIIDLQANGGGTILQGYDLFKQLFPDMDPYGANRFRAIDDVNLIGQAYSAAASSALRGEVYNTSIRIAQTTWFDYHTDMTEDGKPFTSWPDKFGPKDVNGDKYTTLARWNLSDVHIPYFSGGINVTGYNSLANVTGPPVFEPENIVLVTDGYCASTCTIFMEFLTKQAGVKTIAMGGRSNKNQIQAIGGVKGVNNYAYGYIQGAAQQAIQFDQSLNASALRKNYYDDLPFLRGTSYGVNTRDGLKYNDTSGVALQFIYEEANCRLYYTPEMTTDITSLWKAAADAQWGKNGKCVPKGGYGQKRNTDVKTKRLNSRRVNVSRAAAMAQIEAFEQSFSLETECKMHADGFMLP